MSKYHSVPLLPKLTEVSLDVSKLKYSCYVWQVPKTNILAGLINFVGEYRPGSSGGEDALFIKWRINEFCDLEMPDKISGLIVDFRDLDYVWGDDLDMHPDRLRNSNNPVRVIVTPQQFEAFKGVLGEQELRVDISVAFEEVKWALQQPKR